MIEGFSDSEIRAIREWIAASRTREKFQRRGESREARSARRRSLARRREVRAKSRAR